MSSLSTTLRQISSIGFSGSGFLVCYHLGVAQCFAKHGILSVGSGKSSSTGNTTIGLTGVSGGALTVAALAMGIAMEDAMQAVLNVNATCRNSAGPLDVLQPRFSLIDTCEEQIRKLLVVDSATQQQNSEEVLQEFNEKRLLRIGLTDRRRVALLSRILRSVHDGNDNNNHNHHHDAYLYVDQFRDVDDLIAASIVSSYVPGITGPFRGKNDSYNLALARATLRLEEMMALGYIKESITGTPITPPKFKEFHNNTENWNFNAETLHRELFWDGGLVNLFPLIDRGTIIVSPIAADFKHNNSITPAIEYNEKQISTVPALKVNANARIHLTVENTITLRCMMFSSEDSVLEVKFRQGYDNATGFLERKGILI